MVIFKVQKNNILFRVQIVDKNDNSWNSGDYYVGNQLKNELFIVVIYEVNNKYPKGDRLVYRKAVENNLNSVISTTISDLSNQIRLTEEKEKEEWKLINKEYESLNEFIKNNNGKIL